MIELSITLGVLCLLLLLALLITVEYFRDARRHDGNTIDQWRKNYEYENKRYCEADKKRCEAERKLDGLREAILKADEAFK